MKIQILSDLHYEDEPFTFKSQPNVDVLVIAGDAGKVHDIDNTLAPLLSNASRQFRQIIYVAGNHEYHGCDIEDARVLLKELCDSFGNVHFLDRSTKVIDGVAFVGATLWTDFDSHDPRLMLAAESHMVDLKRITYNGKPFTVADIIREHTLADMYLFGYVDYNKHKGHKTVVVSHHAPSYHSIPENFFAPDLIGLYANRTGADVVVYNPNLWIHGHLHDSCDYQIEDTRVVCNPRGSRKSLNKKFDPRLVIEI